MSGAFHLLAVQAVVLAYDSGVVAPNSLAPGQASSAPVVPRNVSWAQE